jgi:hypothetical protein
LAIESISRDFLLIAILTWRQTMVHRVLPLLLLCAFAYPVVVEAQSAKLKQPSATKSTKTVAKGIQEPVGKGESTDRATRFLLDDDFAVIVLQPRSFFSDPANEILPVEIISTLGRREGGIDPLKIERITFSLSGSDRLPTGPQPAGVIEMSDSVDPAKAFPQMAQLGEPQQVNGGVVIRRAKRPNEASIAFIDDRTIVFAVDEKLDRILAAKPADTRVARRLASFDGKSHLFAVVDLEAIREPLGMLKAAAAQAPPQFQEFFKIPDLLTAIELKLTLAGSTQAQLVLYGRDEQSAAETERLVNRGLQMAREMALASMAQNMRGPDPELQQATVQWLRRLSEKIVKSLTPTRDRNRVTINASMDSGYAGVGVLVSLLLPAVNAARAAAQRNASVNNMRQIAIALLNYHDANKRFPDRAFTDKTGKPLLSWRVRVLPYLEEVDLYNEFKKDEPWDSEHNKKLIARMPAVFANPVSDLTDKTTYLLPVGDGTAWAANEGFELRAIKDGSSKTIALVEVDDAKAVIWTKPEDWELDPDAPLAGLGHLRPGNVFGAAMFDAGVQMIPADIAPQMFLRLLNPADGKPVEIP